MNKITRVAAYGLIMNENKLLLCRLSAAVPQSVGQWTLPGGGLDFGEDPQDAVKREVHEETGLKVNVGPLLVVDSKHARFDEKRFHSIRILYQATVVGGELTYEQDGTTDKCEWFGKQALLDLKLVDLAMLGVRHAFE